MDCKCIMSEPMECPPMPRGGYRDYAIDTDLGTRTARFPCETGRLSVHLHLIVRCVLEVGEMNFAERKAQRKEHYDARVRGWKLRPCSACSGSGHYDAKGSPKCGACGGTGRERVKPMAE